MSATPGDEQLADILEIDEPRSAVSDLLEVVNGEVNVRRTCHGQQVKNGVRGTTDDVDNGDSIDEGLAREDVPGNREYLRTCMLANWLTWASNPARAIA